MWSNHEKNIPARGFSTPPASWKSQPSPVVMPMSERMPPGCKRNLFHVIHKVPSGDSPYVRAKHVQLIDKDPSRAISLFWAAINSGDRVDSALKDMAVVMKQLNRSDEAIEAIKSFRHLCPYDCQESLDNVLVELYKRSGRIEEEIEMLQRKLKNIEEGVAFGGKRTKTARSQGRKIQITIEQEKSRILGNLAWAYLQHHDYGLAEQHYRKALSLEPDKNKQCNLAICLMHMNRIPEAKSLLHAVSASSGGKQMDDSYAKSFERAVEMLTELESKSGLKSTEEDKEDQRSLASPATIKLKEVTSSTEGGQGYISGFINSRRREDGHNQEPVLSDKHDRGSSYGNHLENQGNLFECSRNSSRCILFGSRGNSLSSQQSGVDSDWLKGYCFESPGENLIGSSRKELGSAHKKIFASPATVLYTQPRRVPWRFGEGDQRVVRQEEDRIEKLTKNVRAQTARNLAGELDSTDDKSEAAGLQSESSLLSPPERNWRGNTGVVMFSQPSMEGQRIRTSKEYDGYANAKDENGIKVSEATVSVNVKYPDTLGDKCLGKNNSTKSANKCWADMVEEEEQKLLTGKDLSPCVGSWDYEEEFNDENQDFNIIHQNSCPKSPVDTTGQKLEAFDMKDGYDTSNHSVSPRNPTVRRSLCFDGKQDSNRKKNRLQVFRDITPSPDSP